MTYEAGRELDVAVAERVMGWRQGGPGEYRNRWYDAAGRDVAYFWDDDDYYDKTPAWSPSTDVAAAWEVVELIKTWAPRDRGSRRLHFAADWPSGFSAGSAGQWSAGWHDLAGSERIASVEAEAPTMPLAVCRAALLALDTDPECRR